LRIMQVLWDKGQRLSSKFSRPPGQETAGIQLVLTIVRILEKKGYVRHVKDAALTFISRD